MMTSTIFNSDISKTHSSLYFYSFLFPQININDFVVDFFNSNSLLFFQIFVNPGNEKAMISSDVMSLEGLIAPERLILPTPTPVLPCSWTLVISIIGQVLGDFFSEVRVRKHNMICQVSPRVICPPRGYVFLFLFLSFTNRTNLFL